VSASALAVKRTRDPEADIVVPVVGVVPVALGRAEILRIVVPGTAAQDTATRGRPGSEAPPESNRLPRNVEDFWIARVEARARVRWPNPHVSKKSIRRAFGAGFKR
jgi:hypothetical protein